MKLFLSPIEFEWDNGNSNKNWRSHKVSDMECEEIFFDSDKVVLQDILHSGGEPRYLLLGCTKSHRLLFVVFTIRGNKIRIISARDINKKERQLYEKRT